MARRIRTIKPEILEDTKTATLTSHEFRLFLGLIIMADDYGNLRSTTAYIHGQVFWGDPDKPNVEKTEKAIFSLEESSLIETYEVRGQKYAHIIGWDKHQRVDKPGRPGCPTTTDPEAFFNDQRITYFIRQGETGPIKIGRTSDIKSRLIALQRSSPIQLSIIGTLQGGHRETEFHRKFKSIRLESEWFKASDTLISAIDSAIKEEKNNPVSRTIRETVAPDLDLDLDLDLEREREREREREGATAADKQPPLPFQTDQALNAIAHASNGRFISSKLNKGQSINCQKLIRSAPNLAQWSLVGEWLGAGGDGWKSSLDSRSLSDFQAWKSQSEAWAASGKKPIGKPGTQQAIPVRRYRDAEDVIREMDDRLGLVKK